MATTLHRKAPPARVPSITIRIELEDSRPKIRVAPVNEGGIWRLVDWLDHQPRLSALFDLAIELEQDGEAAA